MGGAYNTPQFIMAILSEISEEPSSSSSSTHEYEYDVFLSFRGDTRLNFTDHLYKALVNAGIATFLDEEEIEVGLYLKPKLENAIKASRASIVVLSEDYASSTWCLNELALILDQRRIVVPIFYHVEPTDVRKQQNSFGVAMEKHKQKMETETNVKKRSEWAQKMKIWKEALTEVANIKGKDAKGRRETEFIQEIVTDIHRRLQVPLRVTPPLLFGMDYHIQFITSWLKDGSSHTADILTIFGIGGIGKTSLANYVFKLHCREFRRSNFVQQISRRCEKVDGMLDLQKQVCGDIPIQVHDESVYTSMIEAALALEKVFLVLDDVDSLKQLHALLGKKGFHPGSKVIITTKDKSLTKKYAPIDPIVQPKHSELFLKGLHHEASLQLLSHHAFKRNNPKEGYEEVSEKLVEYCQGQPLALEVLGESLYERDVAEWEECIETLNEQLDSRVEKVLRMSFDSVPSDHDKELFKHIACFFVGEDREFIETILKACGFRTLHAITNLIHRCLLTIGPANELQMHQLVQEMGRDIVRQESPKRPEERSRLWCHEESYDVLEQNKGTGNLEGLVLDMRMFEKEKLSGSAELKTNALRKMYNLMLLQLNYVQLTGSYKKFPQKLRWLCMHGFLLKSIPLDSPMEDLAVLDMSYSNLESFDMSSSNPQRPEKRQNLPGSCTKEKRLLRSLKILKLSFCKQLRSVGGFFEVPALERLLLENCIGLTEVCESIEQCDKLVFIDLRYCSMLRKLPRTMMNLAKVETLLLDGCNVSQFLSEIEGMDLPADASETSSSAIVEAIPRALRSTLPRSLVRLSLANCNLSDESFPMDFSYLSNLKDLNLSRNPLVSLPSCVRSLPLLEILTMEQCYFLKTVLHPPRTLRELNIDHYSRKLGQSCLERIEFDREMAPLLIGLKNPYSFYSPFEIQGFIKVEAMANVEEKVLRSLGWIDLEFMQVGTWHYWIDSRREVEMYYEFGIFSTTYDGEEMPDWIILRSEGSSISFTVPPSTNNLNLRGVNFCFVLINSLDEPYIRVNNITRNCTWIYKRHTTIGGNVGDGPIGLSHWMFGKNEMEDGDQVTISLLQGGSSLLLGYHVNVKECGVSFVYDDDDGKLEEDPLGYYKSWNHIIGGDLSPFLTTTGEYLLQMDHFFRGKYCPGGNISYQWYYMEEHPAYTAFSQKKFNVVGGTPEDETK